mmetsp:Transcript_38142/g.126327  ORF Transcript_38142/g.126327 Transcript_38142/m.126327 type:complete len:212 (+) Transcript_38142:224-859(+)
MVTAAMVAAATVGAAAAMAAAAAAVAAATVAAMAAAAAAVMAVAAAALLMVSAAPLVAAAAAAATAAVRWSAVLRSRGTSRRGGTSPAPTCASFASRRSTSFCLCPRRRSCWPGATASTSGSLESGRWTAACAAASESLSERATRCSAPSRCLRSSPLSGRRCSPTCEVGRGPSLASTLPSSRPLGSATSSGTPVASPSASTSTTGASTTR